MKTKDPTKRSRGAAIIDQTVASIMGNAVYAYIAVPNENGWSLGIVVEGGHGFGQINGGFHFDKRDVADYFAKGMNVHLGLTSLRAIAIIAPCMRKPTVSAMNR
jgi:hypothetical protein